MTTIAIATKHQKDVLLAPLFREMLGWEMQLVDFDTDLLGTFTPELPRKLSPKEAAIAKAKVALDNSSAEYGLGSEGSIYPDPELPLVSLNTELIALVQRSTGAILVQHHHSREIVAFSKRLDASEDFPVLAHKARMPEHAVILRSEDGTFIRKGITQIQQLASLSSGLSGKVSDLIVESDFRAMRSPSRATNIKSCALGLIERWISICPGCGMNGWGAIGFEFGAKCTQCRMPNQNIASAEILGCLSCELTQQGKPLVIEISPAQCEFCNP